MGRAKKKYKFENLKIEREVFAALSNYSFPGNVRELKNLIERMAVLSNGERIAIEDLPENVRQPRQNAGGVLFELPPDGVSLEEIEKEILRRALDMTGGNRTHGCENDRARLASVVAQNGPWSSVHGTSRREMDRTSSTRGTH